MWYRRDCPSKKDRRIRHLSVFLRPAVCLLLSSCAHVASVKQTPTKIPAASGGNLAAVTKALSEAQRIERDQPIVALGNDLVAARVAAAELAHLPNQSARDLYNFA